MNILPYPAVSLLGICPTETHAYCHQKTCAKIYPNTITHDALESQQQNRSQTTDYTVNPTLGSYTYWRYKSVTDSQKER